MPTFHAVPDDGDFVILLIDSGSTQGKRDGGRSAKDFGHGLSDLGHAGSDSGIAEVVVSEIVGISGSTVFLHGGEIGPGSTGKLRGDAVADILLVEIKIDPLGQAKVTSIGIILHVVT